MEAAERETVIVINDADRKDGYISFWTSKKNDWLKLCKRVGEHNLREVSKEYQNDRIVGWKCRIPTTHYRQASFGLKKVNN